MFHVICLSWLRGYWLYWLRLPLQGRRARDRLLLTESAGVALPETETTSVGRARAHVGFSYTLVRAKVV